MIYIALLRGINVAGKNKIKMAELKSIFETLNYKNITTYIQSGNVVFSHAPCSTDILTTDIENKINLTLGLTIKLIVITTDEFETIINNNPFLLNPDIEQDKLHLTLLSTKPDPSLVSSLDIKKAPNEKYQITSNAVYLYCPNGYGDTKLTNTNLEKKLKTSATTRNWKTILTLKKLSQQTSQTIPPAQT